MAKEDVVVGEPAGARLPDMVDLPANGRTHLPGDLLSRAFAVPGRRLDACQAPFAGQGQGSWPWDSILALQLQAATNFQHSSGMPPAFMQPPFIPQAFAAQANPLLAAQAAWAYGGVAPTPAFYCPPAPTGHGLGPGAWGPCPENKSPVLLPGARVPISQGWNNAYPGSVPFSAPAGPAADLRGPQGNGLDQHGAGCINGQRREGSAQPVQRARMVWTADLHQRFLAAVKEIGVDQAVPKKIMQVMGVEYLTRENVASHLQKYRLQLKRESESTKRRRTGGRGATPSRSGGHPASNPHAAARKASASAEGNEAAEEEDEAAAKEQPMELQDTAESYPSGVGKAPPPSSRVTNADGDSGRPSTCTRSPDTACTHMEKTKSGGSFHSGSSRTMVRKGD